MKRLRFIWLVTLVAALIIPISVTTAQTSSGDVTDLARYFPTETTAFVALRTDDAFIDTLDMVAARIENTMAPYMAGAQNASLTQQFNGHPIRDVLDMGAMEIFGGTFDDTVRTWLGDTMAFGVMDVQIDMEALQNAFDFEDYIEDALANGDVPFALVVALSDADAARDAVSTLAADAIEDGNTRVIESLGYTFYVAADASSPPLAMMISDDALFIGTRNALLDVMDGVESSLLTSESFQSTIAQLPEDAYNALGYLEFDAIFDVVLSAISADPFTDEATLEQLETLGTVYDAIGGLGFGFTILDDDRTFTMDVVQQINVDIYTELGMLIPVYEAVRTDFFRNFSREAALLLIQGDLKAIYEATLENFRTQAGLQDGITADDIEDGLFQAQLYLQEFTGLDLEEDIINWMDNEYALVISFPESLNTLEDIFDLREMPVGFGMVIDSTTDPEAAARVVGGIEKAVEDNLDEFRSDLERDGITIETGRSEFGGGEIYAVTIVTSNPTITIELEAGSNDSVFALGTADVVRTAMSSDGGLPATNAYREGSTVLIDDTYAVALINPDALVPLAQLIRASTPFDRDIQLAADAFEAGLGLLSNSTISSTYDPETGVSVSRATITLSE